MDKLIERLNVAAADYEAADNGDDAMMLDMGFAHGHLFQTAANQLELQARENDQLRTLVRNTYIHDNRHEDASGGHYCDLCYPQDWKWSKADPRPAHGYWLYAESENHAEGCLASPPALRVDHEPNANNL